MSAVSGLQDVQTLIWRLITAPEGVARGAEALREEGTLASTDLRALLRPSATLSAHERLDIYADMYFYRLRDCLAEDYPNLAKWIGPRRFHNLVTDYLLAHPSRYPSLRELGRALPGFLEDHALGPEFPLALGLAALEWARVDVFDETDAELLTRAELLEHAAVAPEACRVALVPAARLLELAGGVLPLWRGLEDEQADAPSPARTAAAQPRTTACVWRRDFAVYHRSLAADEARCLEALAREPSSLVALGEVVLGAAGEGADEQAAGRRFAELLDLWTADGLLRLAAPAPGY